MKKYQVKITGTALADMEEIYNYIASNLQSPDTAMRQYDRISAAIESLDTFPERSRLFDSEPLRTSVPGFVESKYLGNTLATKNQRTQNIWIIDTIRIA